MKIYEFGDKSKPAIMLFPGTCCYWKTNFGHVLEPLQQHFYTIIVSYSGFDETENSTFVSELDEVEKAESYIKEHLICTLPWENRSAPPVPRSTYSTP